MPSKKKSKPSFKVPEDLEYAPQSGWVYRSETAPTASKASVAKAEKPPCNAPEQAAVPAPTAAVHRETRAASTPESDTPPTTFKAEPSRSSSPGIFDLTAKTFTSGMATIGNALMLGAAILTAPLRMGLWIVGFRGRD